MATKSRKTLAKAKPKAQSKGKPRSRPKAKPSRKAKKGSPGGGGKSAPVARVHTFEKRRLEKPLGRALALEVDPRRIEESLQKFKSELVNWANKGRYTKVRFKFRGKQLLPDLPLAAVAAAEGLTFYWGGILRALIINLAGRSVLDVELVNASEQKILRAREAVLSGEVDKGAAELREALAMDRDNPTVHLNLAVIAKLKGDVAEARRALERARALDPDGGVGAEADRLLASLPSVEITPTGGDFSPPKVNPRE